MSNPAPRGVGGSYGTSKPAPAKKAPPKKAPPPKKAAPAPAAPAAPQYPTPPSPPPPSQPADPFAGTPYAGKSAYEIAQQIVNDQLQQEANAISAQMAQQAQYNQNQLSILSQLGQQLQTGEGQFANNYANTIGGLMGSFQGFSKGYQDTLNSFNQQAQQSGAGGFTPGQNFLPQAQQLGGNVLQAALQSNPFTVLPSAYGRMAQMDANLLAANQDQTMAGFNKQLTDLYSGSDSAILNAFQAIQGMFSDAQAAAAANDKATYDAAVSAYNDQVDRYNAATAASALNEKTFEAQRAAQEKVAARLSGPYGNGHLWVVDPNTLQLIDTGKVSPYWQKQGVSIQNTQSEIASREAAIQQRDQSLQQRDKSLKLQQQRLQAQIKKDRFNEAAKLADQKALAQNRAAQQQLAQERVNLEKQRVALQKQKQNQPKKTSTSSTVPGTPAFKAKVQQAIDKVNVSAKSYADSLKAKNGGQVTTKGVTVNVSLSKSARQGIYNQVYRKYARSLFTYYRQLGYAKPQAFVDRVIQNAVGWGPQG